MLREELASTMSTVTSMYKCAPLRIPRMSVTFEDAKTLLAEDEGEHDDKASETRREIESSVSVETVWSVNSNKDP